MIPIAGPSFASCRSRAEAEIVFARWIDHVLDDCRRRTISSFLVREEEGTLGEDVDLYDVIEVIDEHHAATRPRTLAQFHGIVGMSWASHTAQAAAPAPRRSQ